MSLSLSFYISTNITVYHPVDAGKELLIMRLDPLKIATALRQDGEQNTIRDKIIPNTIGVKRALMKNQINETI